MQEDSENNELSKDKDNRISMGLTIEQQLTRTFRSVADWLPADRIILQDDSLKDDLGFDSLELVHLQVAIEDDFEFRFDPITTDFVSIFSTVRSLTTFLSDIWSNHVD